MPRPPDVFVDAHVSSQARSVIERIYSAADLPRVLEAGVHPGSKIEVRFAFSLLEGRPAIEGELRGALVTTCQRCMKPVTIPLEEHFRVLVVDEERADEPQGYEPVTAEAGRLDLDWLSEEQALLALPFAPMHEPGACEAAAQEARPSEDEVRRPFAELRSLLRDR